MALALVQEKVRYLLIEMNGGGYRPTNADVTWSRRYGDCKAKTVLLIALLRELGVAARPVLVSMCTGIQHGTPPRASQLIDWAQQGETDTKSP